MTQNYKNGYPRCPKLQIYVDNLANKGDEIPLTTFIDEFGDFLARKPNRAYGLGFFTCNEKDMITINKRLRKDIPEKIHLRKEKTPESLYRTVEKVASFLTNCKEKIHGGGLVFPSNPIKTMVSGLLK